MRYRHLIWDWNGTLFDDLDHCVDVINGMLARRSLPMLSHDDYRSVFTFPVRDYYQHVGFDFARESFEALSVEFIAAYEAEQKRCTPFASARPVLERVIATGRSQSILSAYAHETLVPLVHSFELGHLFEHLMGLDNIYAHSKRALGERLVAAIGHGDILLIGDTLHDHEVAAALGIDCVLVAHGHQSKKRLQQSGVPVMDSLLELDTWL